MARLRSLYVGTETTGDATQHKHILVLDGVTSDEAKGANIDPDGLKEAGLPPLLVFGYDVDLPDQSPNVVLDVTRDDTAMKDLIRKMVRADASVHPYAEF
ncbi:hypothetical protein F4561_006577 [Lipingzhangella halophila]|uniref:Uncharacterized protein n=1 Tax=Lipingzhangella halophila TaxID=1783352 RepID=A0A7W7W6C0_9ACTN|nr:hypothetical protein [Lipingzhangella halophila]MBB4935668.1 hypothetical protein [Lipingzhangella halophila]